MGKIGTLGVIGIVIASLILIPIILAALVALSPALCVYMCFDAYFNYREAKKRMELKVKYNLEKRTYVFSK